MTFRNFYWLPIIMLASCARQTSPTGGPKDTIPPILLKSFPAHEQTNFNRQEIELLFSEDVIVNNPKEQIIITPDIAKKYEAKATKNKVIIKLENKLRDSTTYSFNFRDAFADVTEKNPVKNLKIAISTGSYVDSLSIQGMVTDPLKNKPFSDVTVSLYESDTFNILKHKPTYLTKTDKEGRYIIENLKPNVYYIYAMDDKNKNLVADSKTEAYGFLTDNVVLKSNTTKKDVSLIKLDARSLKLTNSRPYNTYFNIKTSKNLADFRVTASNEFPIASFGEDNANIRIYNTFDNMDSVAIHLQATDSIQNNIDTTIYAKFNKREVKKETFSYKVEGLRVLADKGLITANIVFNKPLFAINFDSIIYRIDSAKSITFVQTDFTIDSIRNTAKLIKSFDKVLLAKPAESDKKAASTPKPATTKKTSTKVISNEFYIGAASFISIELDSTKKYTEQIKPSRNEDNAIIFFEIQTNAPDFIIQLLDKSFTIVQSVRNIRKGSFSDNPPGEYQIRVIQDKNKDGEWTPGNYLKRIEPEQIKFYQSEKKLQSFSIKANWEIGPLLIKF